VGATGTSRFAGEGASSRGSALEAVAVVDGGVGDQASAAVADEVDEFEQEVVGFGLVVAGEVVGAVGDEDGGDGDGVLFEVEGFEGGADVIDGGSGGAGAA